MRATTNKPTRGRPRLPESFADWMARVDSEVEALTRKTCCRVPAEKMLNPEQRRIVEMLAEHLRSLPVLGYGESLWGKKEYGHVKRILIELFEARYPNWKPPKPGENYALEDIPNGEGDVFTRLLRNCGGRAPVEENDDD